ncbi:BNIP3 [Popillia japonica]|uniref:BNIP3 n=1 Tax=Popillia japonica TaxID=7064 RepID=A0AAW1KSS1_POPJA
MSSTKSSADDLLGESWVHVGTSSLSGSQSGGTPGSVTPQIPAEECLRLLREAQRESNSSSARVSPRSSPKSPPNSPVQETPLIMEWQSYYLNTEAKDDGEFFTDWSSRPDQQPPKNWGFRRPKRDMLSLRYAKVGNESVFSRKGLCTLFLSNLLSLLLGAGVGFWLSNYHCAVAIPAGRSSHHQVKFGMLYGVKSDGILSHPDIIVSLDSGAAYSALSISRVRIISNSVGHDTKTPLSKEYHAVNHSVSK